MSKWNVNIITIFPEIFPGPLGHSLCGKALEKKLWGLDLFNLRDYSLNKHKRVDDKTYGGGAGMVMKPDVIGRAIDHISSIKQIDKMIYFTPRGTVFKQQHAQELLSCKELLILCGRYEAVDQRVFEQYNFVEYSVGDYILSGGEMAALTVIDACVRLMDGVIDNNQANQEESFIYKNLLEYDHYTKPVIWKDKKIPEILLSGNHKEIEQWRLKNALDNTSKRRPDLIP
jgi:tRNA (guanine37-N1)-methyltransferase